MKKIAIQGILGSYHHQVALAYYGDNIEISECMSFDELAEHLSDGRVDEAVMAIENSLVGSIIPNYAIINDNDFFIIGEYYISVEHHLLALPNQQIEDIKEVCSHPMAILQCKEFLKNYPHIKKTETSDTAAEANRIFKNNLQGVAAIAGVKAAEFYHLEKVASFIQTSKNNTTRFVIIRGKQKKSTEDGLINKASIRFVLSHKKGSLSAVLNVMSDCKLNLTKIQSLPIVGKLWKYAFFVDITFSEYQDFCRAKDILVIMAEEFKVLGEYKNRKL